MSRAERNHVRALFRGLKDNALLPLGLQGDLEDGFTSFEEAYERLIGVAQEAAFAHSIIWGAA